MKEAHTGMVERTRTLSAATLVCPWPKEAAETMTRMPERPSLFQTHCAEALQHEQSYKVVPKLLSVDSTTREARPHGCPKRTWATGLAWSAWETWAARAIWGVAGEWLV
jgi:hypothetical protein